MGASVWWKRLKDYDDVEVKHPYERHRLAGRPSNKSKSAVRSAFLTFVNVSSHPNGRQAGSNSPHFLFIPKFTWIDLSKPREKDFDTKTPASLVWTFNHTQEGTGGGTRSAFAARKRLLDDWSKSALHPHKSNYCDTCKYLKEEVSRQQAVIKRLSQSGSAQEQDMRDVEVKIKATEEELCSHKTDANAARDYYNQMVKKCRKEREEISKLSREQNPSQDTVTKLTVTNHTFTLVLSADFQQSKLIPHWGRTEQPGTPYVLPIQKVSHDIFGLVDQEVRTAISSGHLMKQ